MNKKEFTEKSERLIEKINDYLKGRGHPMRVGIYKEYDHGVVHTYESKTGEYGKRLNGGLNYSEIIIYLEGLAEGLYLMSRVYQFRG